jgi:23S rRNA (adenine2030-N6)-methyltransferase
MKYRHAYHAGNFADVHKHVALLHLVAALQRKPKGFLYLETHAGRGHYELGAEADAGYLALRSAERMAAAETAPLQAYLAAESALAGSKGGYSGSPLLAAQALRTVDRGVCCELQPPELRALERALAEYTPAARLHCQGGDGFHALREHLPPPERRALVAIDPPYEESRDFERVLESMTHAVQRLANVTVLAWYPIKDERTLSAWRLRAAATVGAPLLALELWLFPRDAAVALNGSGLLIANPPFQFDVEAGAWQAELARLLGAEIRGGHSLQWLVHGH